MATENDPARTPFRSRADWPVRKFRLGEEPCDVLAGTTAEERIEMMWPLALEAWLLSGRVVPDYERKDAPVRCFFRPPR